MSSLQTEQTGAQAKEDALRKEAVRDYFYATPETLSAAVLSAVCDYNGCGSNKFPRKTIWRSEGWSAGETPRAASVNILLQNGTNPTVRYIDIIIAERLPEEIQGVIAVSDTASECGIEYHFDTDTTPIRLECAGLTRDDIASLANRLVAAYISHGRQPAKTDRKVRRPFGETFPDCEGVHTIGSRG